MQSTLTILVALLGAAGSAALAAVTVPIVNSDAASNPVSRFDVDGNALDAHDGTLVLFGSTYYLYGTSYACGYGYQQNSNFCGFKVYSSPDLVHWTDRGFVVPPGSCAYCFRPHVIYNAATNTYVLWSDAGGVYHVYSNSTPTGAFTRRADPTLAVGGAVDEALFLDDNGAAYLIHNTTIVAAGLTADMVVEPLTPDYLNTTGASARLGLGDVEAFTVFKRNGVYHALMSDPSCAYCSGGTGEMTATSMLGPWTGQWYDANGVHQSGRAEPRWRARLVNNDNCGGQPMASLAVAQQDGTTGDYFVSDRWNDRKPNESLANFFIGPMTFDANGVLNPIQCVGSFTASLAVGSLGTYNAPAQRDQHSGFDGFRHYCDVQGTVQRQQSFTPSRGGLLTTVGITTFQDGSPNAALTVDIVGSGGTVLSTSTVPVASIPWAPFVAKVNPRVAVTAGQSYTVRLRSATTAGCYGFEYNDGNVYAGGLESYSVDSGASFIGEAARDLKFTTEVDGPAGYSFCASENGTCSFGGTASVAYGANGIFKYGTYTGSVACNNTTFGDPVPGTIKACYDKPAAATPTIVNLSSAFNVNAAYSDGTTFASTGGIDGVGSAYSSTLLGASLSWSGTTFTFGAANALNGVRNATITLPAGPFATLMLLGTGVNGDQASQTIRVNYTDGTSSTFTQTFSNWLNASQNVAGQSVALTTAYRNKSTGVKDNRAFNLYGYSFALTNTKTVSSLVLPATNNVSILAATLRP